MIDVRDVLDRAGDNVSLIRKHRVAVKRRLLMAIQELGDGSANGVGAFNAEDDILLDFVDAALVRIAERGGLLNPNPVKAEVEHLNEVLNRREIVLEAANNKIKQLESELADARVKRESQLATDIANAIEAGENIPHNEGALPADTTVDEMFWGNNSTKKRGNG